jgi:MAF protein
LFTILIRFILASQSPRRHDLLSMAGYPFQVIVADVDEATVDLPDPAQNSIETARLKARTIAQQLPLSNNDRVIIIAADTNVALDDQILGKPADAGEAGSMLRALRGRDHQVHTGMSLIDLKTGREVTAVQSSTVTMRSYNDHETEQYIASGDPLDKAGAYAIQHPQFRPVTTLDGCFLGVMGLSVCQLLKAMEQFDLPPRAQVDSLIRAHQGYTCSVLSAKGRD